MSVDRSSSGEGAAYRTPPVSVHFLLLERVLVQPMPRRSFVYPYAIQPASQHWMQHEMLLLPISGAEARVSAERRIGIATVVGAMLAIHVIPGVAEGLVRECHAQRRATRTSHDAVGALQRRVGGSEGAGSCIWLGKNDTDTEAPSVLRCLGSVAWIVQPSALLHIDNSVYMTMLQHSQ